MLLMYDFFVVVFVFFVVVVFYFTYSHSGSVTKLTSSAVMRIEVYILEIHSMFGLLMES